MAQLAIKGHATRGREVIQLLEMLGGKSNGNIKGYNDDLYYYIAKDGLIYGSGIEYEELVCIYTIFTLEEFLEKFPYKVGDKVIYEDKIREITKIVWEEQTNTIAYKLDDKLYCNVIDDLQPYKEETNMNKKLAIKGHKTRGKKVIRLLEMLGGKNIHNYVGTSNECYTIDDNKICTIYTSVAKIDNCVIFTLEEFEEKFPYKVGDKVITKDKFIGTIRDIRWQGDIVYTVQVSTTAQITYQKEDLQPYEEELTMKKKSKLINIEPKLVGNECVHFPIPIDMKLEVKDGMCYLYRDCGEQC